MVGTSSLRKTLEHLRISATVIGLDECLLLPPLILSHDPKILMLILGAREHQRPPQGYTYMPVIYIAFAIHSIPYIVIYTLVVV